MTQYFELTQEWEKSICDKRLADHFYIYFIGGAGLVKIGRTIKPVSDRLNSFQTGSPVELELLATAIIHVDMPSHKIKLRDQADRVEKVVHKRFSTYRRHGEWFSSPWLILREVSKSEFWFSVLEEAGLDSRNVGFRFTDGR